MRGSDAIVRRWIGALFVLAAALAVVAIPGSTGFVVSLALLAFALAIFATTHTGATPFEQMRRRARPKS